MLNELYSHYNDSKSSKIHQYIDVLSLNTYHDITMHSYQTIAEPLTQQLISKVLYKQSLHTNLLSFLIVSLHQYKTLTSKLH